MIGTVRMTHATAFVLAILGLWVAVACGQSESDGPTPVPTPEPTFADGLTAQDIIDKSNAADTVVRRVRFRSTSITKVEKSDRSVAIIEGLVVGDDAYFRTIEGDGPQEVLQYEARSYSRQSPDEDWSYDADFERFNRVSTGITKNVIESAEASGGKATLTRIPSRESDGDRVFVIDAEFPDDAFDFKKAFEDVLREIEEAFPDAEEYPDEFLPDDWRISGRLVIGRDDFHLLSFDMEFSGEVNGELFIEGERRYNFWDHNADLELPGPLPERIELPLRDI